MKTTAKMVTLRNNFHNASARVRVGELSEATVRRVRKTLCGIKGCTCGDGLGMRGPQELGHHIETSYADGRSIYTVVAD